MKPALTFAEAAQCMLVDMRTTKPPFKEATFRATESRLRIINEFLGAMHLSDIKGVHVKRYVSARVAKKMSGSTVNGEYRIISKVIQSVVDDNLQCLYPIQWNENLLGLPSAKPSKDRIQKTSIELIESAVAANLEPYSQLIAFLAFTGMRLGEGVACRIGTDNLNVTHWDADESLIRVRTAYDFHEHSAKTEKSAERTVDLCSAANDFLRAYAEDRRAGFLFCTNGDPLERNRLFRAARKLGIGKFHGLRRARIDHLYSLKPSIAEELLITFWCGHETKSSQTREYQRLCENIGMRRELAESAGIGFALPFLVLTNAEEENAMAVIA